MSASKKIRRVIPIALSCVVMVGCKNNEAQPAESSMDSSTSYDINDQSIVESSSVTRYDPSSPEQSRRLDLQIQPSGNRPILQGKLPLKYLIDDNAPLCVVDQNGNAIASIDGKSGWVLTVNDRGVFLGQKKIGTITDTTGVFSIQLAQPVETIEQPAPRDGQPAQRDGQPAPADAHPSQ